MSEPQRLVLFDIDCTLIDAHDAGGRAIVRAIAETYGVTGTLDGYSFHGRTDPAIVVDLATRWGTPEALARERLAACLKRYVALLRDEVRVGLIEVLPGVEDLVNALAVDERVLLGLLTGNVREGVEAKLAPTGLLPSFKVIADASDSAQRSDLPAVAVRRAEALSGRRFAGKEIVIIGDSPADVLCGADLGVKAIAVATGRHSVDDLAEYQPDFVFPDFAEWRRAYAAILR